MGPLSNLHRKARELFGLASAPQPEAGEGVALSAQGDPSDRQPADRTVRLRAPRREELHGVVRALLSAPGRSADDAQTTDFLRHAADRRIDLTLLRVAERRGRVLWSLLPVLSPGRTSLLLCWPAPTAEADGLAAGELIEVVCRELRGRGVHLAQVLLDLPDVSGRKLFSDRGFASMSELIYLSGEPRKRTIAPTLPPDLFWVPYSTAARPLFGRTIAATYERSLDCPAMNGLRDIDDVIAGHQASGEFDPALWRLLGRKASTGAGGEVEPLGVLLLSRVPQVGGLELVYLGLSPAARGQRLGDLLIKQAMASVVEQGASRLTLAVDALNAPALRIYYRNGLSRVASKLAMMRDLRTLQVGSESDHPTALDRTAIKPIGPGVPPIDSAERSGERPISVGKSGRAE